MATLLRRKPIFYYQLRKLHKSSVVLSVPSFNMTENKKQFCAVLPEVMNSLLSSPKIRKQFPEVGAWLKKLIHYNVEGGHLVRGLTVPIVYRILEAPENFTEEKLHTAHFLGWCIEVLQAYIITMDDIIDMSPTRRSKPCWHLLPGVGSSAINDCLLIYQCLMEVLRVNFKKAPYYVDLIELMNEAILHTSIGQYLDHCSGYTEEKNNTNTFTMERLNNIVGNKTAYYSFRLPMLVARLLVKDGKHTEDLYGICWDLGKFLQIQNDYRDIYLDEAMVGKVATDIQEGKLSWMAVKAIELFNKEQRATFHENYGSKDPEHIKKIKQLYDEIKLDKVYKKYERTLYDDLVRRINALPSEGETQFFLEFLKTYRKPNYKLLHSNYV